MKERLYGWYPPARDIYLNQKIQQGYDQECLYRHYKSRFNTQAGVATPPPPTALQIQLSPRPSRKPSRVSSAPCYSHTSSRAATPAQQQRPESAAHSIHVNFKSPHPPASRASSSSPKKAWATKIAETQYTQYSKQPEPASIDRTTVPHTPDGRKDGRDSAFSYRPHSRPERVQSAASERPRPTPPSRPVKSAGPTRTPPAVSASYAAEAQAQAQALVQANSTYERPEAAETHIKSIYERPSIPTPFSPSPPAPETPVIKELGTEFPLDYDEELEKHGWRMEIPGDPLNLKRPCIRKRLAFTMKCAEPEIPPNPPKSHMVNFDTFFLNTIPRRQATFTIHKDMISEVLHGKRMALQKREEGYNYRMTNFAFAY